MKIQVAHQLDPAEALSRIKALTAYWRDKYGIESRWTETAARLAGTVLGTTLQATLEVGRQTVVVEGPDPGILLRHQAAAYISGKLGRYLQDEHCQPRRRDCPGDDDDADAEDDARGQAGLRDA